jgi:Fe-S-cluster-containing dehydrogenase component/CRP-like cAMP-binding protein
MADEQLLIDRPERWEVSFGAEMSVEDVERLLKAEPFRSMDPDRFPPLVPLWGILRHDTRLRRFDKGDIILRQGDYGHAAFLILSGSVRVVLELDTQLLGRRERKTMGFFRAIAQLWTNPSNPEVRTSSEFDAPVPGVVLRRAEGDESRVFLQDFDTVVSRYETVRLGEGEMFGELSAMGRTPRTATIVAEEPVELLEIRWQGLRDLRFYSDRFREHIDRLYRERGLKSHLQATPLFDGLSQAELNEVAAATEFETYGRFDWQGSYKSLADQGAAARLGREPLIEEEGHYPNGLILVRSGFVRVSIKEGHGSRTVSYLGKGKHYGLAELAANWKNKNPEHPAALRHTLRALGYLDVLRVPTTIVEKYVLPRLTQKQLTALARELAPRARHPTHRGEEAIDSGMLEFLVEQRFINGTATMLIDMDRCTRCDDCIRACASTHENNPRFIRHGPIYGHHMVANACMHCQDPVCMIGCPTGAIHRDPVTGDVVINERTCIGCATCANSCPYDNIRMVEIRDDRGTPVLDAAVHLPILKATKCDLCVEQWGGPACQRACPHDALLRADMRDLKTLKEWLE